MGDYLKLFETHAEYQTYEQSGDMIKPNVSYCEDNNCVHYNPYVHDYSKDYLTIKSLEDNNEIRFYASTSDIRKTVSISTDNGATWTEYVPPTTTYGVDPTAILNTGEKLLIKGENETYANASDRHTFFSSKTCDLEGNIMSLIYGDNFATSTTLTQNYCFFEMFMGLKVVNADKLILAATTLSSSCYSQLFYDCTYLVKPPVLPATTLASSCYNAMFVGCTALTTAPELPVTTLAGYCYKSMFQGCTSLVNAPALPATTLISSCYRSMFQGCTSLVNAPALPATTLISDCYRSMFYGCTNLNYIKAMFTTTPSTTYTRDWVSSVAANGTFVKNAAAEWDVSGVNGVPSGWTIETASE